MNDKVSKKEILVFVGIIVAMLAFLLYGFLAIGIGQVDNCWEQYQNAGEETAIQMCEVGEGE
jgi:hypothetical protein